MTRHARFGSQPARSGVLVLTGGIALGVLGARAASAQGTVGVESLVDEALRRHPAVRSAERSAAAASELVSREGALPDPMIAAGVRNLRVDSPKLSSDPMSGVELMLTQDIPFPGKLGRRAAVAGANADAARSDAHVTAVGIALRVRQNYWKLSFAQEAERVTREGVDLLGHLLEITRARFSVGQAAQQDVLQAAVALSRAQAMLEERKQMAVTAARELASAVGRAPDTAIGPVQAPSDQVVPDRQALVSAATRANPDVLAMTSRASAAARAVDEASYDRLPDLQLIAGYMFRAAVPGDPANGADMFSAGIGVTLPLWLGQKQNARVRSARASMQAAEAAVDSSALNAATAVQIALDMVDRLTREIALFENDVMPKAAQAVESGTADYRFGKTGFVSLLQNWQALLDAQLDLARFRSERAQALAEIHALTGGSTP